MGYTRSLRVRVVGLSFFFGEAVVQSMGFSRTIRDRSIGDLSLPLFFLFLRPRMERRRAEVRGMAAMACQKQRGYREPFRWSGEASGQP